MALSVKEADQIKAFVKRGGVALADLRPGVCDEHGRPYEKGILDETFGIRQNTRAPEIVKAAVAVNEPGLAVSLPETVADASLQTTTGSARSKTERSPAIIVNTYGQGKAILLNFLLVGYVPAYFYTATGRESPAIGNSFKSLCALAGMEDRLKVDPAIPYLRNYRFGSGSLQYLGLLQELPDSLKGADAYTGQKSGQNESVDISETPTSIGLLGKYHVYDARRGVYLGYLDRLDVRIRQGVAQLYSLLPYKVGKMKLKLLSGARQGENLEYFIKIDTDAAQAGLHVFHISLIAPDGKEAEYYNDNLKADQGAVNGVIRLALNERPGKWKMAVKDVASGVQAEKQFKVKEK